MAKLIYSAIASLDGYVEDDEGKFDWGMPDEEVHAFVNELERPIGTYLYGRRMYETMVFWETAQREADEPSVFHDYAGIWQAADKVVYSRTLERIQREDPDRERVRSGRRPAAEGVRRRPTSQSAAPSSPARRSARGWSTSPLFLCRSWWVAASAPFPTASARNSSCSTSAGSATASVSSTTASRLRGRTDADRGGRRRLGPAERVGLDQLHRGARGGRVDPGRSRHRRRRAGRARR